VNVPPAVLLSLRQSAVELARASTPVCCWEMAEAARRPAAKARTAEKTTSRVLVASMSIHHSAGLLSLLRRQTLTEFNLLGIRERVGRRRSLLTPNSANRHWFVLDPWFTLEPLTGTEKDDDPETLANDPETLAIFCDSLDVMTTPRLLLSRLRCHLSVLRRRPPPPPCRPKST